MNQPAHDALIEKLKMLAPEQFNEVVDFVDFLRNRSEERAITQTASRIAEPAFAAVWDNEEDAVYDQL